LQPFTDDAGALAQDYQGFRNSSGSLAIFTAIRRAWAGR
jgi:hypothetical protein